jgi:hypothetical protein
MKRTLFATIALVAGIILIVALALVLRESPGRHVENWQTIVNAYIEHKGWAHTASVEQAIQADNPENFAQGIGLRTLAQGPYYVVDEPFGGQNGSKPLPYPPEDVWCVLLKHPEGYPHRLIFAVYHVDLYSAEWVIHEDELAPFNEQTQERVAQLGCTSLGLQLAD